MGYSSDSRHFELIGPIREEIRHGQIQKCVAGTDGRNSCQGILRYVAILDIGAALFQIDSRMATGDSTAMQAVAVAIPHNICFLDHSATSRSSDIDTRGSAVMNIGLSDGDMTPIDINDSSARTG